jgi:peptide chain release factor 2
MEELRSVLRDLQDRAESVLPSLNLEQKKQKLLELEEASAQPGFWDDRRKAETTMKRITEFQDEIAYWSQIVPEIESHLKLLEQLAVEKDATMEKDVQDDVDRMLKEFRLRELSALFFGKYDTENAIVGIHAGAGGVDAQDWASMLLRMYLRFFERMNFDVKVISESSGEEAGIKSATLEVRGAHVFGYLQSENGVHRLVRQSPFNANSLRQTSFALVEVIPLLEDIKEITIDPKELRIDTFRASGAGGQHVNKTDSAVRITHLPTKMTVEVQSERSQAQNKERAMSIMQSKLHILYESQREAEKRQVRGEAKSAEWGNQIRSYVLHPYKLVKDHRTNHEEHNAENVLDGDIFPFVEAFLKDKAKQKNTSV